MARYQEIAIGALERGVRTLAKKLEKQGFKTDIGVFRTGPGGTQHYGPSYVDLEVQAVQGEEIYWTVVRFLAGGYVASGSDISGTSGWKEMAERGLKQIMTDLEKQGWKA